MAEIKNLMEGLLEQMSRVREAIQEYKSLPDNVGFIGASLMALDIKAAEQSISSGDVIEMIRCYEKLKSIEL